MGAHSYIMGVQIITKCAVIYCKTNERYYIYDPNNKLATEMYASAYLCGKDEVIKDNLTCEEATNFLLAILKLKSIPK